VHSKGAVLRAWLPIAILAVLSLFPVSIWAQDQESEKGFQVTGMPIIDYNRSTELKLGAIGMGFFPMSKGDTVSPASTVGLAGFYTTNKTWAGGGFARLFWSEDTYRLLSAIGLGSLNFQFYDDEVVPGGAFIDFNTGARFGYAEISRRVVSHFYAGVLISISSVRTEFGIEGAPADTIRQWVNGWGLPLQWDTRDNIYNATSGVYSVARTIFNQEWLGSDFEYTGVNFSVNGYQRLSEEGVLAGRFDAFVGLGDVPFEGQRVVGRDDIRGYTKGEYRGDQVYAVQAEYRRQVAGRIGGVAFAGLALAVDENNETSPLLPGAGVGVRYMALVDYQVNIGVDVAVGRDDWGIYFRIGEAF
jgi:outer membrane protein assembly factor BamA